MTLNIYLINYIVCSGQSFRSFLRLRSPDGSVKNARITFVRQYRRSPLTDDNNSTATASAMTSVDQPDTSLVEPVNRTTEQTENSDSDSSLTLHHSDDELLLVAGEKMKPSNWSLSLMSRIGTSSDDETETSETSNKSNDNNNNNNNSEEGEENDADADPVSEDQLPAPDAETDAEPVKRPGDHLKLVSGSQTHESVTNPDLDTTDPFDPDSFMLEHVPPSESHPPGPAVEISASQPIVPQPVASTTTLKTTTRPQISIFDAARSHPKEERVEEVEKPMPCATTHAPTHATRRPQTLKPFVEAKVELLHPVTTTDATPIGVVESDLEPVHVYQEPRRIRTPATRPPVFMSPHVPVHPVDEDVLQVPPEPEHDIRQSFADPVDSEIIRHQKEQGFDDLIEHYTPSPDFLSSSEKQKFVTSSKPFFFKNLLLSFDTGSASQEKNFVTAATGSQKPDHNFMPISSVTLTSAFNGKRSPLFDSFTTTSLSPARNKNANSRIRMMRKNKLFSVDLLKEEEDVISRPIWYQRDRADLVDPLDYDYVARVDGSSGETLDERGLYDLITGKGFQMTGFNRR